MGTIKKIVKCKAIIEIDQEIELNEEDAKILEDFLEKSDEVKWYVSTENKEGLVCNPVYDILHYEIDLDEGTEIEFKDIILEDAD